MREWIARQGEKVVLSQGRLSDKRYGQIMTLLALALIIIGVGQSWEINRLERRVELKDRSIDAAWDDRNVVWMWYNATATYIEEIGLEPYFEAWYWEQVNNDTYWYWKHYDAPPLAEIEVNGSSPYSWVELPRIYVEYNFSTIPIVVYVFADYVNKDDRVPGSSFGLVAVDASMGGPGSDHSYEFFLEQDEDYYLLFTTGEEKWYEVQIHTPLIGADAFGVYHGQPYNIVIG